jgi:hypothetical protein
MNMDRQRLAGALLDFHARDKRHPIVSVHDIELHVFGEGGRDLSVGPDPFSNILAIKSVFPKHRETLVEADLPETINDFFGGLHRANLFRRSRGRD